MTLRQSPDEFHLSLAPATRAILDEIKRDGGYRSDVEAMRAALALHHHLARRLSEGFCIILRRPGTTDRELRIEGLR